MTNGNRMRFSVLALTATVALSLSACTDSDVKEPAGNYAGPGGVVLQVSDRSIELLAFDFPCRNTRGRTSLNAIPLEKGSDGFEFSAKVRGIVSYRDGRGDENGETTISGQFATGGRSVSGELEVGTKRCGPARELDWRASGGRAAP